jgi:cell division protein FtsZ
MKEIHEVMNTIREFTAEDATVIFGAVFDENMTDDLRVTMVATGLGMPALVKQPKPQMQIIKTGTDAMPADVVDYGALDQPAVMRRRRDATVESMKAAGVDLLDIPAFLRKQAD